MGPRPRAACGGEGAGARGAPPAERLRAKPGLEPARSARSGAAGGGGRQGFGVGVGERHPGGSGKGVSVRGDREEVPKGLPGGLGAA